MGLVVSDITNVFTRLFRHSYSCGHVYTLTFIVTFFVSVIFSFFFVLLVCFGFLLPESLIAVRRLATRRRRRTVPFFVSFLLLVDFRLGYVYLLKYAFFVPNFISSISRVPGSLLFRNGMALSLIHI